jgi:hypothetical protein
VTAERVLAALGALLPVAAVGGIAALSEAVDPPEEKPPGELERLARVLCTEGARVLIKYGHDIGSMAVAVSENRMPPREAVDKLERIASSLEREISDLWEKAERTDGVTQQIVDAVRSSFSKMPPEYVRAVVKYISLGGLVTGVVHASLKLLSDVMIHEALDSYCTCLRRAGVICTSQV